MLLNVGLRRYVVFSRVGDRAVQLVCLAPRPVTDASTTTATAAADSSTGGAGSASSATSGQDFVLSTFLFKSKEAGSLASHLEDILDEVRRLEPAPSKESSSSIQDGTQQPESSTSKSVGESDDDNKVSESSAVAADDKGSSENQSEGVSD